MTQSIKNVVAALKVGAEQILPEADLVKKLKRGKPLTVKFGMDPTAPDLHLGHAVVLSKLRQFQDLGHNIIYIIGDFTALIGDPSGKSKTRPTLTTEQIEEHAKTYFEQVGRILDLNKMKIVHNSEWLSKIALADFIKIASRITLARIIERDDFQKRLQDNVSIGFHELFYPLLQAQDSVELHADIELGGTDQTFNLLMGRYLQEHSGQEAQVILTMPILEGLDGVQKMSKSLGNYVGLTEPADTAYGKLMSISDDLMWRYYELLLFKSPKEITVMKRSIKSEKINPMNLKKQMAFGIITRFWSEEEAQHAQSQFEALFQKRDYTQAKKVALSKDADNPLWIIDLLKQLGAIKVSSEGKRLLQAGAVDVDGKQIKDFKANIAWKSGMIIKVGKHRIYKIK